MSRRGVMPLAVCAVLTVLVVAAAIAAEARIDIEPETGVFQTDGPLKAFKSDQCSGGKCVGTKDKVVPEGQECGGYVKVKFNVSEAGTYVFWGRAWWADSCGNSFYVQIDSGSKYVFGEQGTYKKWTWFKGPKFSLSEGEHTLWVMGREDGALLDKVIFLPSSSRYEPQGMEG